MARQVRPGREQSADRQADIDGPGRCDRIHQATQVVDDQAVGQLQLGIEGAIVLAAQIVDHRAKTVGAQGRADLGLPGCGIAGNGVDEHETRPAFARGIETHSSPSWSTIHSRSSAPSA